ncbi:hypothetical protein AKJ37_05230 [candidate division MSBL1 archaeon SCGC-AAA259I09]|uniref:Uncharacterized protein n=1 Tax=candidate division MSBL1 archaeon SCGC-AAA259I09 TaxID=1698267 RepID=A0A133UQE9_9EURY|nr:hypothetical protein AKJ37_05230 [candidate division MSBL1 archaeon SCGC-AAA259I09]
MQSLKSAEFSRRIIYFSGLKSFPEFSTRRTNTWIGNPVNCRKTTSTIDGPPFQPPKKTERTPQRS